MVHVRDLDRRGSVTLAPHFPHVLDASMGNLVKVEPRGLGTPHNSKVTFGKVVGLSRPQFPHL